VPSPIFRTPPTASKTDTEKELRAVKRPAAALKENADRLYRAIQRLHIPALWVLDDVDTARIVEELGELDWRLFRDIDALVETIDKALRGEEGYRIKPEPYPIKFPQIVADQAYKDFFQLSGKRPTAHWSQPKGRYASPFVDLVTGLFDVLGIGGSAPQAAYDAVQRGKVLPQKTNYPSHEA